MEKMQAIVHAHSTIRNAYNRPQFNQFKKEHEKLVNKFINDGSRRWVLDLIFKQFKFCESLVKCSDTEWCHTEAKTLIF